MGLIYVDSRLGKKTYTEDDLRLLTSLANVAAAKIQNAALTLEAADKKRMERDFFLARRSSRSSFPTRRPSTRGTSPRREHPSKEVSGDYYDFRQAPDGKMYVVTADVCSKERGARAADGLAAGDVFRVGGRIDGSSDDGHAHVRAPRRADGGGDASSRRSFS